MNLYPGAVEELLTTTVLLLSVHQQLSLFRRMFWRSLDPPVRVQRWGLPALAMQRRGSLDSCWDNSFERGSFSSNISLPGKSPHPSCRSWHLIRIVWLNLSSPPRKTKHSYNSSTGTRNCARQMLFELFAYVNTLTTLVTSARTRSLRYALACCQATLETSTPEYVATSTSS